MSGMADNPHFRTFETLEEAEVYLGFNSLGRRIGDPTAIEIHVRDHRLREVTPTLELHYEHFVLTQRRLGAAESWRAVSKGSYGPVRHQVRVGSHIAFDYELGDEPGAGDSDPRQPAVVNWSDGELFCLLASDVLEMSQLLGVTNSLYERPPKV
jgi:hypothetical protein